MNKKYDYAVTVGRFQVADLHYAHIKILYDMMVEHKQICVFLGVSTAMGTQRDPLDFPSRKKMLEKQFPNIIVKPLLDQRSDEEWSQILDREIKKTFPKGSVLVYGGRDSFLERYSGKYDTKEFPKINHFPGTEVREKIGKIVKDSAEWREGQIYLTQQQYPRVFFTVDVAVLKTQGKKTKVLLGKKTGSNEYRFVGGFIDPTDESSFHSAKRELFEESDLDLPLDSFNFLTSIRIDDWRYRNTKDGIMTNFFIAYDTTNKKVTPKDDICYLAWVDINNEKIESQLTSCHAKLFKVLKLHLENKGK